MNPFETRVLAFKSTAFQLKEALTNISTFRLIVFLGSAIFITVLANYKQAELLFAVVPLCTAGFILLVQRHKKVEQRLWHTLFLQQLNEHEVHRIKNQLSGFATGKEFVSRDHSYISDLDVFGSHSLFQLLNRTTMESSQDLLAAWLSTPASKTVIIERQKAIAELSPMLEWRQDFQATGMHFNHTRSDYDKLSAWVEKPIQISKSKLKLIQVASIPLSLISTWAAVYFFSHVLTVATVEEIVPYFLPLLFVTVINGFILRIVKSAAEDLTDNIKQKIKILDGYQSLMGKIQSHKFHSSKLQNLQASLQLNGSAVAEITKLKKLMDFFQIRGARRQFNNFFYSMFNLLWFIDVHMIVLTDKWKDKNGDQLKEWASSVNEFEVLNSVAGFHFSNPSSVFPEVVEGPYTIYFEMVGHPLIGREKRVCNTFNLNGRGEIAMITGSNMAGKSTFLRTLGTNIVLALMGAPCCAQAAKISNLKIFSSMRTQDNLEEGVSSFYAELKRIEQLLTLVETGQDVFFLLDEMFKGTNSKDRQKGGISLIHQLKELNAFGVISTHDLELAVMSGEHKLVKNLSFNSSIHEGAMVFDYALTQGICSDFNASELMRRSGIKILADFNS